MKVTLLLLFIIFVVVILAKKKPPRHDVVWPFYSKKLLSAPEQVLYFRLTKALPDHIILAQVQLSRLLGVKKGNNYQSWLNRINRMSADFVVCNKDASIVAVIELDDATHASAKRRESDAKKDKALSSAGITIHRWQAKGIPDESTIMAALLKPVSAAQICS